MSSPRNVDAFPYLSEDDINLLHSIIVTAEADATSYAHPVRAVFAAYYSVLAAHSINPDNDGLYLRFLLRMREGASKSDSLLDTFTNFLRRLGIQVVFDQDDDENEDDFEANDHPARTHKDTQSASEGQFDSEPHTSPVPPDGRIPTTPRRRRESFTNLEDTIQSRRGSDRDARSFDRLPIPPRSQSVRSQETRGRDPLHPAPKISRRSALKQPGTSRPASLADLPRPSRRTVVQIREDPSLYEFEQSSETTLASGDESRVIDLRSESARSVVSDQEHNANAKKLRFHFLAAHACKQFWVWRRQAKELQHQRRQMSDQATAYDKRILLKQAYDQWRTAYLNKQSDKETQRFFDSLEKRAGRARDIYLLTRAFTHWAQCASDSILEASAARRHILRTRYFNAWRDTTVVNELKVRHQGLAKFLVVWRNRNAHVSRLQADAADFRHERLAANSYRNWFWGFCDRKAPVYYSNKLLTKALDRWSQAARSLVLRQAWTDDFARMELSRRAFLKCKERLSHVLSLQQKAQAFRRRSLMVTACQALQRELEFRPRLKDFHDDVDTRLTRSALSDWYSKMRLERGAQEVNDLRITRNAFTTWNDHLRCLIMKRTIDERLSVQVLYHWVVAERLKIAERVRAKTIKQGILLHWRSKMESLCGALGQAGHQIQTAREERTKQGIIQTWSERSANLTENNDAAILFRERRLACRTLKTMTAAKERLERLDQIAGDARFFCLGLRTIKQWRAATVSTRKARRREAYSHFRRDQKVKMARSLLLKWHRATETIQDLRRQSEEVDQTRLVRLMSLVILQWSERTSHTHDMLARANDAYQRNLLRTHLQVISVRLGEVTAMSAKASVFEGATRETSAAKGFQKLTWHMFQFRRHEDTAASFAERTSRKHRRFMLRHWAEKATAKRGADFSQTIKMAEEIMDEDEGEADTFEPRASVTSRSGAFASATPGYLRTPSRRAVRARAVDGGTLGTTPATTQITPFWSRMREVYPSGVPRSARPDLAFARRIRQDVIPETSPPNAEDGQ